MHKGLKTARPVMVYIYQSVHLQSEPTVKHCFFFFLFLVAVLR